jgi:hypothetical protein
MGSADPVLAGRAGEPDWPRLLCPALFIVTSGPRTILDGSGPNRPASARALNNAALGPAPASTVGVVRCRYVAEVTRVLACPSTSATSSSATPVADSRLAAECRSSCGCQRPRPAFSVTVLRARRRLAGSSNVPRLVGKTRSRSAQCSPKLSQLTRTVPPAAAPRVHDSRRAAVGQARAGPGRRRPERAADSDLDGRPRVAAALRPQPRPGRRQAAALADPRSAVPAPRSRCCAWRARSTPGARATGLAAWPPDSARQPRLGGQRRSLTGRGFLQERTALPEARRRTPAAIVRGPGLWAVCQRRRGDTRIASSATSSWTTASAAATSLRLLSRA